jgi:hypothetical protein
MFWNQRKTSYRALFFSSGTLKHTEFGQSVQTLDIGLYQDFNIELSFRKPFWYVHVRKKSSNIIVLPNHLTLISKYQYERSCHDQLWLIVTYCSVKTTSLLSFDSLFWKQIDAKKFSSASHLDSKSPLKIHGWCYTQNTLDR